MGRRLALVLALLVVPALPPTAAADDLVIYAQESGHFVVGSLVEPVENVTAHAFVVTPVEGHHRLRFQLGFEPQGATLDTPVVAGTLRYRMQLELYDAETGAPLPHGSMRYEGNGTRVHEVPDERPVRVVLWLVHGADVTWRMRVSALPDPVLVE